MSFMDLTIALTLQEQKREVQQIHMGLLYKTKRMNTWQDS